MFLRPPAAMVVWRKALPFPGFKEGFDMAAAQRGGIPARSAASRAQRTVQMPFQQDADVFAHGAVVGAGLSGQIVVERFGQMQLDIAVALEATTLFDGSG